MPTIIGYGSAVAINDGSASAFVDVPDVVSIKPATLKVDAVESKRLNLTNRIITAVAGMTNPGEFSYTWEFDKNQWTRHQGARGVARSFRLTVKDVSADLVATVPGFILSNEIDTVEADKITTVTTTVRVTGAITEA